MVENLDLGSITMSVAFLIGLRIVQNTINRLCRMSEYAMKELGSNTKMVMAFKAGQGEVPNLGPALLREANKTEPQKSIFKQKPTASLRVGVGVQ